MVQNYNYSSKKLQEKVPVSDPKISTVQKQRWNRKNKGKDYTNGSVTVEAAMAIPIFLFAILCIVYILEIQSIRFSVSAAAQHAGKLAAEQIPIVSVLNPIKLKADIVNMVGAERLDRSIIDGGSAGIHCFTSYYDTGDEVVHIYVNYRVKLPFPQHMHVGQKIRQEIEIKAWTGYPHNGLDDEDDSIVYIADTGSVYHTNYQCSALHVQIQFVPQSALSGYRNESGGRYYACEHCVHGSTMSGVYIADYGTKYHNSLNCSSLKRSIRSVKKSQAGGRRACSKCAN